VCPTGAITEIPRQVGLLEVGHAGGIQFAHGLLNIGEAMSPPVIRAVKKAAPAADWQIIDAPPGTSCPVIESVRDSDFVALVTEPTPFGLNDLTLAVDTMRQLGLPFGVVVNRADVGDHCVVDYCNTARIRLLAEIPDDRRVAEAYSHGELAAAVIPGVRNVFEELAGSIDAAVLAESGTASGDQLHADL
jgi:MinD superfamily P-loop ATPase